MEPKPSWDVLKTRRPEREDGRLCFLLSRGVSPEAWAQQLTPLSRASVLFRWKMDWAMGRQGLSEGVRFHLAPREAPWWDVEEPLGVHSPLSTFNSSLLSAS